MGKDGVPLIYIICENPDPKYNVENDKDYDFEQLSI